MTFSRKNIKENYFSELHLHVLQAMGLVDPQYSHCFLATDADAADVPLESPAAVSSIGASAGGGGGSDSASWELTRRPLPVS